MVKKVLIGLVVIVAAFAIFVATRPDAFKVERVATVAAPPDVAFAVVNDFHRWGEWSPWEKKDAPGALKKTYEGAPMGLGASYSWVGDKTGEGKMSITDSRAPTHVGISLEFIKPFQAKNNVDFAFEPQGASTQVRWTMTGNSNFMMKAMGVFKDMDAMIGPDFEQGLAQIKVVAEADAKRAADAVAAKKAAEAAPATP